MGGSNTIFWLNMILVILVLAIVILGGAVILIILKRKKQEQENTYTEEEQKSKKSDGSKVQGRESIHKFMEFDEVIDNMIVRKNRTQYIMVIQCKGINYDLLSESEKEAVENGFTQFLNTLRFPIQLYVQTRSLNLHDIIEQYREKVDNIQVEINQLDARIKKARLAGNKTVIEKLEFEKRRKNNVLEYGNDISNYVERMSQNQNVLQQNTYVIISYYTAEFGGEINNYSKEEIDNISFSELYTRVQAVIRSLASAEVYGRVLESEELAELLYIAYNRDESEVLNLRKAFDAGFNDFYVTSPDILEKKKRKIEQEIEEEAVELATSSLLEADRIRMLENSKPQRIKERANEIVDSYKDSLDKELYKETKRQIENSGNSEEENAKAPKETKKIQSKRTKATKIRRA